MQFGWGFHAPITFLFYHYYYDYYYFSTSSSSSSSSFFSQFHFLFALTAFLFVCAGLFYFFWFCIFGFLFVNRIRKYSTRIFAFFFSLMLLIIGRLHHQQWRPLERLKLLIKFIHFHLIFKTLTVELVYY